MGKGSFFKSTLGLVVAIIVTVAIMMAIWEFLKTTTSPSNFLFVGAQTILNVLVQIGLQINNAAVSLWVGLPWFLGLFIGIGLTYAIAVKHIRPKLPTLGKTETPKTGTSQSIGSLTDNPGEVAKEAKEAAATVSKTAEDLKKEVEKLKAAATS